MSSFNMREKEPWHITVQVGADGSVAIVINATLNQREQVADLHEALDLALEYLQKFRALRPKPKLAEVS